MDDHQKPSKKNKKDKSHVYEHYILPDHEMDFDNVEIRFGLKVRVKRNALHKKAQTYS